MTPARANYFAKNAEHRRKQLAEKSDYDLGYEDGIEAVLILIEDLLLAGDYAEILIKKIKRELDE